MITYRWTWLIKHTRLEEASAIAKASGGAFWRNEGFPYRIYASDLGPGNNLIFEADGKDEAQFTEAWKGLDKWSNTTSGKDFWKKFNDTVERFVSAERLNMVEKS